MSMNRRKRTLKEELASRIFYDDSSGKNFERRIIEGFLNRLQLTYYKIRDSERPDFWVSFGDDSVVVGLELISFSADSYLTGKTGGSMERRLHAKWRQFATSLRRQLDKEGLHYIYGAIHFKNTSLDILDRFDNRRFQNELIQICSTVASTLNPSSSVDNFSIKKYPLLCTWVNRINLRDCYPETGILWWCGHLQSGNVESPTESLLQAITVKASKASSYNWNHTVHKWLLVYAAGTGLMDLVFVENDLRIDKKIANIPFSAVFLWNKFSEDITELYPHFRIIMSGHEMALYVNHLPLGIKDYAKKTTM